MAEAGSSFRGILSGKFWLGNDNLRNLTEYEGTWQIRLDMTDWNFQDAWFEYGEFRVSSVLVRTIQKVQRATF